MIIPKATIEILKRYGRETVLRDVAIPRIALIDLIETLKGVPVYLLGCDAFIEREFELKPLLDGWSLRPKPFETLNEIQCRALTECQEFCSQSRLGSDTIWFVPVISEISPDWFHFVGGTPKDSE